MEIPLVDIGALAEGSPSARRSVASALDRAFAETGFAVVTGHGLDQDRIRELRTAALEFFSLDDAAKRPWAIEELSDIMSGVGWVPMGLEANGYIFGEDTPPDLKETFAIHRHAAQHPLGWPAMVTLGQDHLEAATAVYEALMDASALALELEDPEIIVGPCRDAPNALSVNWYPAVDRVGTPLPGQYRVGPHTDFGTMTLLDREPGLGCLQVQLPGGEWVDAPHVDGGLIVNVADLLAMWSGGRWRSARHRVLPPSAGAPAEQLVSLVAFCEARSDTVVAPLPGSSASFEPVIAGEWLAARMAQITVAR